MKQKIRINENQLKQIVTESVKTILCEIGDTRRGQYKLGKLWRRKYDDVWDKGGEDVGKKAYDAAKSISDYAHENNRKSFDGKSAFDLGSNAKWNEEWRNQELAKKGKTKRKSEAEIYRELSDKDAKENVMSPDEVYRYSLEWLKSHEKMVLRYRGDSYAQKRLSECGCKNLGEYIIYCYENGNMPGWIFFQIYANKIYKELNLYYDGSTANADREGFVPAWESFCEYVYETYKSY